MIDELRKILSEGSDHYKAGAIEPAEFIAANSLNFFEGNVVKYVVRHRRKNGAEDLRKARHYINMLLAFEYNEPGGEAGFGKYWRYGTTEVIEIDQEGDMVLVREIKGLGAALWVPANQLKPV